MIARKDRRVRPLLLLRRVHLALVLLYWTKIVMLIYDLLETNVVMMGIDCNDEESDIG